MALAAVLALAGCGTDSPPNRAPSPASASATGAAPPTTAAPTASSTPVYKPATANGPAQNVPVPVLPPKAKEFSKAGLEAFATYWYSTLGYAFETGNADPMMKISDAGCETCTSMKNVVIPWHSEGRWIVGGQMFVLSSESSFVEQPDHSYQAITEVRQQQVKFFRADKSLAKNMGVTKAVADIVVAIHDGEQWRALTVEHLAGSSK
ncbi:DUF6318 family protein [Arthrobacter sp. STN4]|uniref:DUF6318 family protein n=1 Tax=Arthrobacter sp. STN4 TaxID=2923276 RepID=UPI00211A2652|nr:DUF6318 family protein [Arthrobacter sp. STN4]MCQ9166058.1 DUF6318 family protein [Arthrobacter sp. STN4]